MMVRKKWKKTGIMGVIIMAVLASGTTACGKNQSDYEEQALDMLEEKYGEKFVVQEYLRQEYFEGYFSVICYSENAPHVLFEVKSAQDGSYIEDGYVSAMVCNKVERQIDSNLEHLGGYLLEKAVPVSRSVDSAQADMSVEEFMELKPKNRFAVYLMYCPQEKGAERAYGEIQKTFQGLECMSGNIQFYIMEEEELRKMQEYFASVTDLDYRFQEMTDDVMRITIPFENGIIQMSEDEFVKKAGGMI